MNAGELAMTPAVNSMKNIAALIARTIFSTRDCLSRNLVSFALAAIVHRVLLQGFYWQVLTSGRLGYVRSTP
jgi:hypothetical protein